MKITTHLILTFLLFSIWAIIALVVVNPLYHKTLPGYTIGRICIWEYMALVISFILSFVIVRKWGYPTMKNESGQTNLVLNAKYAYFLVSYLLVVIIIAVWQFLLFSQQF